MSDPERGTSGARFGSRSADSGLAVVGSAAGGGALFSAAACCVLPLALAGLGVGSASLAAFVPLRWPLTLLGALAVAASWFFRARRKQACKADPGCALKPPSRATSMTLSIATGLVLLSALWGYFEAPLLRLLGGA